MDPTAISSDSPLSYKTEVDAVVGFSVRPVGDFQMSVVSFKNSNEDSLIYFCGNAWL